MNTAPHRNPVEWKKYFLAFFITALIFSIGIYINSKLDQKRYADIQNVQDQISMDLLSSETQFALLQDSSCKNIGNTVLSQELNSFATKLSYMEANNDTENSAELLQVKKNYSLLEIKDFILMKRLSAKCKEHPIAVLYFYGSRADCPDCEKMGFVLTYLREQYPDLRIYSFDNNLSLSAVDTLKSMYKIDGHYLPALIINDETYTGFRDIDSVKNLIPALKKIDNQRKASSTSNIMHASSSTNTSTSSGR